MLQGSVWLARDAAEVSDEWVQPIPCALIRSHSNRYLTLRRIRTGREDLRSRISLVVGGHIDRPSEVAVDELTNPDILLQTLHRELNEELGLSAVEATKPVGIVIDRSSISASRHIAFVYEVTATGLLFTSAVEEFSIRSRITGQYFTAIELARFRRAFDPWSRIIFDDWIAVRNDVPSLPQPQLPFPNRFRGKP
jgi:predicted NUDIX family phosphoesterase